MEDWLEEKESIKSKAEIFEGLSSNKEAMSNSRLDKIRPKQLLMNLNLQRISSIENKLERSESATFPRKNRELENYPLTPTSSNQDTDRERDMENLDMLEN
jgi:hypothetical protein